MSMWWKPCLNSGKRIRKMKENPKTNNYFLFLYLAGFDLRMSTSWL